GHGDRDRRRGPQDRHRAVLPGQAAPDGKQACSGPHRGSAARVGDTGRRGSRAAAPRRDDQQEQAAAAGAEAERGPPARGEGEVEDSRRAWRSDCARAEARSREGVASRPFTATFTSPSPSTLTSTLTLT